MPNNSPKSTVDNPNNAILPNPITKFLHNGLTLLKPIDRECSIKVISPFGSFNPYGTIICHNRTKNPTIMKN